MTGESDDETNFPYKLLITDRQVSHLRKAFSNNSSTDIKLSKTQLSKTIQSGAFLGKLLDPLLRTGLPLMKTVIKPLAKCVLIPLGLTAAASAADAGILKKILESGTTTLIISNDQTEDIIKTVKSLKDSGILLKGVCETVQNKVCLVCYYVCFSMLLGTLVVSLLGNILAGKGINKKGPGTKRTGEEIVNF